MKRCFKCGETKPLNQFYRHSKMADGHLNKCKECAKADVGGNYALRREQYQAYERSRQQRPERRAAKGEYQRRYRARNPLKRAAREAVADALEHGRLMKGPCAICGTTDRVEAHHHDYTQPLNVRWLCFRHHREVGHCQYVAGHTGGEAKTI